MKKQLGRLGIRLLIFLVIGEIVIRVFFALTDNNVHRDTAAVDEQLGWRSKAFYSASFSSQNQVGEAYDVDYTTQKYGFRFWGNTTSKHKKVLFLGDSFTQAAEVSDHLTFYHRLAKGTGIEYFAYGMSGYGTLQELMILEKYVDQIQPDVLVLQLCTNDFIDNHYELALDCMYEMPEKRPYWQANGEISYHIPLTPFRQFLQYMKFPEFVYKKSQLIAVKQGWLQVGEGKIANQGTAYAPFQEAVAITDSLFGRIKATLPDSCLVLAFCADTYEPQYSSLLNLARKHGFQTTTAPQAQLISEKQVGKILYHQDGVHWSPTGHGYIAKGLHISFSKLINTP